ncbi:MAG TPA: hypothetical protein VFH42_05155, partial [Sporolactobacillaceae bacterium]|nr:hypothetical protein [Sporolactobacillaceae bacterium]
MGTTSSLKTDVIRSHVSLQTLAAELLERHERPEDRYEVAAILESMGYNDERATHQFGVEDVFELAHELWMRIEGDISFVSFSNAEKKPLWLLTKEMIRSFLRGLIFAFPMGVSVLSMLTLQYSLWSYVNMTLEQATSIAIGTILSFITVGGFTQAIARRGFFYIIQGYYNLAKKNTFQFIIYGFIFCFLISFLLLGVNFIFNLYPYRMVFTLFLYFFFLNAIWLSVTVMYILRKEIVFTGLIILGIGLVFFLFQVCQIDILISQIISLCLVSLISIGLVLFYFYREEKKAGLTINLKLPRLSITFYSVAPYFFYGFLYFSFLFVDRVNAWSTNETFMPYVVWFRGDYEVGLDFAILTLILPMGVSEVIVTKLMYDLESSQKDYLMTQEAKLYHQLNRSYRNMSLGMVATGLVSAGAVYLFT